MKRLVKSIGSFLKSKKHALMINHDLEHLRFYKDNLSNKNIDIDILNDKSKVISHIRDNNFDFIILDCALDLLEPIRDAGIKVPVVIISDFDTVEEIKKIYDNGCLNVLLRSLAPDKMLKALKSTIIGSSDKYLNETKTYLQFMNRKLDDVMELQRIS